MPCKKIDIQFPWANFDSTKRCEIEWRRPFIRGSYILRMRFSPAGPSGLHPAGSSKVEIAIFFAQDGKNLGSIFAGVKIPYLP